MYRGTWDDDARWTEFLHVYDRMALFSPLDRHNRKCGPSKTGLAHMDAIFDDRAQFENASMEQIRSHFREWAETKDQVLSLIQMPDFPKIGQCGEPSATLASSTLINMY